MKISNAIGIISVIVAIVSVVVTYMTGSGNSNDNRIIQNTSGDNSPTISGVKGNVVNITGDVMIKYSITKDRKKSNPLIVLDIEPPRNNEDSGSTRKLISFFDDLNKLDGEIIYIRFYTYVGAGIGINNVPKNKKIRAGVTFNAADYLDGFGGSHEDYEYGYTIELDEYRNKWAGSRQATLLFPKKGNAFFEVHYMKSMSFEGLARIKVSEMQGFEWIEIIPAEPFGDLMDQYNLIRKRIKSQQRGKFEF